MSSKSSRANSILYVPKAKVYYLSIFYELQSKADGYEDVGEPHQHPSSKAPSIKSLWRLGQPEGLAG